MQASISPSSFSFSCRCPASSSSDKSATAVTLQNGASFVAHSSPPNRAPGMPEEKREKQSASTQVSLSSHGRVICSGKLCTRRHLLQSAAAAAGPLLQLFPAVAATAAAATTNSPSDARDVLNQIHPPRPDWYEEFYARTMNQTMISYEEEVASYKKEIFSHLRRGNQKVLELGVGTGPNFKYYAGAPGISILGIDPNEHMEKYACVAAKAAGLPARHFSFAQAVGEALPIGDASMDAIVGTLVLCSVKDVNMALKEVKRVLKPGGLYMFVEHVAASEGTPLRFVQNFVDPLQQIISDGCHLTRDTEVEILKAGFSVATVKKVVLSSAHLVSPHIYGIARK